MNKKNEFRLWTLKDVEYKNIKQMIDKKEDTNLEKIIDELLIKLKTASKMLKLSGQIAERYKKENDELKRKVDEQKCAIVGLEKLLSNAVNVKTLNRDEVGKIVNDFKVGNFDGQEFWEEIPGYNFNEFIAAICELAKPKIDKEKIIQVIKKIKDCICEPDKIDIYLHEILKELGEK